MDQSKACAGRTPDKAARRQSAGQARAARSPAAFGRAYLPHYFTEKSPPFHDELDRLWRKCVMKGRTPHTESGLKHMLAARGRRLAVAAPRGHAKSTVMGLQNVLHAVLYGYKKYVLLISDTEAQAANFLDAIKVELEENEALLRDFGDLRGKVWKSACLCLTNGARIDAVGSGQKLRGRRHYARRPDLIVLDDIENDEEVRARAGREKLASWYFGAVSKAGDRFTDIVCIGTILHHDSLLSALLKNPAYQSRRYCAVLSFSQSPRWDEWRALYTDLSNERREEDAHAFFAAHEREMLDGAAVLWPQKMPYYDLMCMRVSEGELAFNREMQNAPVDPHLCLFPEEWLVYYNPHTLEMRHERFSLYGYCDPSLGRTADSDYSAIVTIAHDRDSGVMYVIDADIARRHPDAIIADILGKAAFFRREYGKEYTAFGAEINQFQWFLKEQLVKESARAGLYLPVCEVRSSGDKTLRIQTLQPDIKNGYIRFDRRHETLLRQLMHFPMDSHDDGPDALEGCVALCKRRGRLDTVDGLRL